MNTNLLTKENVQFLVEEASIEQALETSYDEAKDLSFAGLEKVDEHDKSTIIELRNDPVLARLHDYRLFVSDQVTGFGKAVLANKISLSRAMNGVFKINLVLGTKYSVEDLFKGAKIVSTDDKEAYEKVYVEYSSVDLGVVNTFKSRLEKICMAVSDCLFNDLYDKEVLNKYLPTIYCISSLY